MAAEGYIVTVTKEKGPFGEISTSYVARCNCMILVRGVTAQAVANYLWGMNLSAYWRINNQPKENIETN